MLKSAKRSIKRSPLAPLIPHYHAAVARPRDGLRLFVWTRLGQVPSRLFRNLALRRMGMTIAPGVVLYGWRDLRDPAGIEIGSGTTIGFWATLDGREGITIGSDVNLSSEVALWTLQHDPDARDFGVRGGPIVIEDRAWISFRATILPGLRIGEGAVVAANAVVTKDVEPFAIVAGIPAMVVGRRSEDIDYVFDGRAPWFV